MEPKEINSKDITNLQDAKNSKKEYRSLSRIYRPLTFDDVVAQDVTVKILSNAIIAQRFPHALIFTGIRGVGKTTTARIVAKALNCENREEQNANPCGICITCKDILNEQHLDVIEMDAASKTGVDDIREIIDSIKYKPSRSPYKVYIIDEVHMLSKNAFNALLKTLEEPPAHVKFIFATTEINKIPKTVLSRCMRFDLQRFDNTQIKNLLNKIAQKEKITIEPDALEILTRFSEGSARDGVSLLDQAISMNNSNVITQVEIVKMLGVADLWFTWNLLQKILKGETKSAIIDLNNQYIKGTSITSLLTNLADWIHYITIFKTTKILDSNIPQEIDISNVEKKLGIATLNRYWQILIRGIEEVKTSYNQINSARMLIIKLCFVSDLPTPDKLVEMWKKDYENTNIKITSEQVDNVKKELETQQPITDVKKESMYFENLPENLKKDPILNVIKREFPSMEVEIKNENN